MGRGRGERDRWCLVQKGWSLTDSLNHSRVSTTATVRNGQGIQYSLIMDWNKTMQEPVHRTTIEPHDGQEWSMRNARHFLRSHVNSVLIGTNVFGLSVPCPASGKKRITHVKKMNLEDRRVFIFQRLHYFAVVVSSAACFAAGHGTMYRGYIQSLVWWQTLRSCLAPNVVSL